ncbi:MAG: PKD domain-containing protein [Flavobacteriales bacterium]|nr:gliding motility-associated C-terminal domain-containing protein [Flavobacteriales bacterium]
MTRNFFLIGFVLWCSSLLAHDHVHTPNKGYAGLEFHQNKGQWPGQVLYRARTDGGAVFIEKGAFTYVITSGGEFRNHGGNTDDAEPLRMHAYSVKFAGADMNTQEGIGRMPHYVNYFLGNDPSKWGTGAGVFEGAMLNDMYPGIDLRVSGKDGLKYDWLVAAGADPALIAMHYQGQDKMRVEGGMLFIETSAGRVVEQRPVAWQVVHGTERPVAARYVLKDGRVQFEFPDGIDPNYPLVIDPVVTFSTYSGSNADNFGLTATYDETGNLYGGGSAFGIGYPTTLGVQQPGFGGGTVDMGITKFDPTGATQVWSTYIGGTGNDIPHSMVVNSADELYILGTTSSTDLPLSAGAFETMFNGGTAPPFGGSYGFTYTAGCDIAVIHLDASATSLIGGTYVGGTGNDGLNQFAPLLRNYGDPFRGEIIMDLAENPIIITSTTSANLFTSPGAVQSTFGGGLDAYLFRLDPFLSTMSWATYYGGTGVDAGFGVQISSTGEIYATGGTQSADLLMTGTPASGVLAGQVDGYIARFSADGSTLLSSTYLGTSEFDQSYFVQLDTQDDVYVVGQTAGNYPITPGKYNNANGSQFIHKFSNDLSTSIWSTRIGSTGVENISPSAFLVSICGQIYFSGWGGSTNPAGGGVTSSSTTGLPVTADAFQPTTDGSDFYLMVLNQDAISLAYATFFGGTASEHVDGGTSRFDKDGVVYQAVCAGCGGGSFPTTPGAWSNTNNSFNCNLGVFKIDFEQGVSASIQVSANGLSGCLGSPITFTANGNAELWTWDLGDGSGIQFGDVVVHTYSAVGVYNVMLIGSDSASCNGADTAFVMVNIIEPFDQQPEFAGIPSSDCQGFSAEFFNTTVGDLTYFWDFGDGQTSASTNPVHTYSGPGNYDVVLAAIDLVCLDTVFLSQRITLDPPATLIDLPSPVAICNGSSVQLSAGSGFDTYAWSTGSTSSTISVTQPGDYWVTVTDGICVGSDTIQVVAQPTHPSAGDVLTCPGDSPILSVPFVTSSVVWNTGDTSATILATGSGDYSFVATDEYGCIVLDTVNVTLVALADGLAFVPNVFSPNGDSKNDTFQVTGLAVEQFSMQVFNRWGQEMYSASNPSAGWNGGLDNTSNKAPDGTYFYIISFKDRCDTKPLTTHKGHVTLVR